MSCLATCAAGRLCYAAAAPFFSGGVILTSIQPRLHLQ
jgi:hypothetical protein